MIRFTNIHRTIGDASMTRGSERNSRKYGRSADAVGASGVPNCNIKTSTGASPWVGARVINDPNSSRVDDSLPVYGLEPRVVAAPAFYLLNAPLVADVAEAPRA
jgi:hypothetical protein